MNHLAAETSNGEEGGVLYGPYCPALKSCDSTNNLSQVTWYESVSQTQVLLVMDLTLFPLLGAWPPHCRAPLLGFSRLHIAGTIMTSH